MKRGCAHLKRHAGPTLCGDKKCKCGKGLGFANKSGICSFCSKHYRGSVTNDRETYFKDLLKRNPAHYAYLDYIITKEKVFHNCIKL
jgi:hypothetical protein